jgi:hypothetical protein
MKTNSKTKMGQWYDFANIFAKKQAKLIRNNTFCRVLTAQRDLGHPVHTCEVAIRRFLQYQTKICTKFKNNNNDIENIKNKDGHNPDNNNYVQLM